MAIDFDNVWARLGFVLVSLILVLVWFSYGLGNVLDWHGSLFFDNIGLVSAERGFWSSLGLLPVILVVGFGSVWTYYDLVLV